MNDNIIWVVEGQIGDGQLAELKALMEEMVSAVKYEAGTLNYEWTLGADNRSLHVYERYASAAAAAGHLQTWSLFAERFLALVSITQFTVYSDLPPQLQQAVAGLNPVYMTPLGGFARSA